MTSNALRTAVSLYDGGTLGLGQAARAAGVRPDRMRTYLRRYGTEPADVERSADD